jgi:hypothetical protein
MTQSNVSDFLFAGGAKAFGFAEFGDTVSGEIIAAEVRQQTSIEGELLTWPDGKPRQQLVITLQTKLHEDDDDDGQRTIYAKGGRFDVNKGEGQSMRDAIAEAVRVIGAKSIEVGDELAVSYTGEGVAKRGYNAPKLYTAGFRKAKPSITESDLFGDGNERAGTPF